MYGVLLLTVVVITAYFGVIVLARFGPGQRVYGAMLVADSALAGFSLWSLRAHGPDGPGRILGTVAIFAAVFLVLLPPILRELARRALARERYRLARVLVEARELLQPGMGGKEERELIDSILAVQGGDADGAVSALAEERERAETPAARRQIDERIVTTFLYARRWEDAVAHFEASFSAGLGGAPVHLVVEMVRAYCEVGDLETAGSLIVRVEEAIGTEEPSAQLLVARARLVFLAFTGRADAVEKLAASEGPLAELPASARAYWLGVARLQAGDREGAAEALEDAVREGKKSPRVREIASAKLEEARSERGGGPRAVPASVASLADRLADLTPADQPDRQPKTAPALRGVSWRKTPVTSGLIAVNLVVAAAVFFAFGATADVGGLARAGGNLKGAVIHGEWWRLASSMFLHAGLLHLAINMYALYILGKLTEQIYGPLRIFGLYVAAGLSGSVASLAFGGPIMSVGASGAVFGLLGAATVELALHRDAYPPAWRRALLGNFLFLIGANVVIGFAETIDQAAHMGGLVAGGVVAALLSPHAPIAGARAVRLGAGALAAACAGFLLYGAVGVATTSYVDTIKRYPVVSQEVGGLELDAPVVWEKAGPSELRDPSMLANLFMDRREAEGPLRDAVIGRVDEELGRGARELGFESSEVADAPLVAVPEPWEAEEIVVEASPFTGTVRYRAITFGRESEGELWMGTLFYPEALADGTEVALRRALESARPAAP